jgi:hypothetical protein
MQKETKIKVIVRIRPFLEDEPNLSCTQTIDNNRLLLYRPGFAEEQYQFKYKIHLKSINSMIHKYSFLF